MPSLLLPALLTRPVANCVHVRSLWHRLFYKPATCDLRPDDSDRRKLHHSQYIRLLRLSHVSRPSCGQPCIHGMMHIAVIFHLLSVFPSHLRLLNGQAKVRYCHNALAMFCGVRGSTYRPYLCTDYRHA